jgi:hypothetical protein
MTEQSEEYMRRIGRLFFKNDVPNRRQKFNLGQNTLVHDELRSLGYIKWQGKRHVLTDLGFQWMLEHRAELEGEGR